jgi:diaminopimelate decarboxylase
MPLSRDREGHAVLGGVRLATLLERADITTPFYAYDVDAMVESARALASGYGGHPSLVCYAVKANTAGRIIRRLGEAGVGADIVSAGELDVVLGAGIPLDRIVWSGVAKTNAELDRAISLSILSLHVESIEEIDRIAARARSLGKKARISIRINPDVEADTHAGIATGHDEAKFGIAAREVPALFDRLATLETLTLVGLSAHVGSQMTTVDAYVTGAEVVAGLARAWESRGSRLELIDFGGGMGIDYGEGCAAVPADFARAAIGVLRENGLSHARLLSEPGRAIVGAHGVLVARVIGEKRWSRDDTRGWIFLDAGMNDLIRPALYGARHRIEPLVLRDGPRASYRVAGPVCESSDDFGTFELPDHGLDAVVIRDAGAYSFAMASQYNGRSLPAEVFVEGRVVTSVARSFDVAAWARARLAT